MSSPWLRCVYVYVFLFLLKIPDESFLGEGKREKVVVEVWTVSVSQQCRMRAVRRFSGVCTVRVRWKGESGALHLGGKERKSLFLCVCVCAALT